MNIDSFADELLKIAYGELGHTNLTQQTAQGMGLANPRVLTEYGATIADAGKGTGVMATRAAELEQMGGLTNKLKAKALRAGSYLGSAADTLVRHPHIPLNQARHGFGDVNALERAEEFERQGGTLNKARAKLERAKTTLPEARQIIRSGREGAAANLAAGALETSPAARQRKFIEAMGHAGESAHVAQDIPAHMVRGSAAHQQALANKSLAARGLNTAAKVLPGVSPLLQAASAHKAEGTFIDPTGELSSHLDDVEHVTKRESRGAYKHGRKIRIQAIQRLREQGIPTQQAVQHIDDMLRTNPSALNEIAGKGVYRAKTMIPSITSGVKRLLLR